MTTARVRPVMGGRSRTPKALPEVALALGLLKGQTETLSEWIDRLVRESTRMPGDRWEDLSDNAKIWLNQEVRRLNAAYHTSLQERKGHKANQIADLLEGALKTLAGSGTCPHCQASEGGKCDTACPAGQVREALRLVREETK